jgi:hypothetical protein
MWDRQISHLIHDFYSSCVCVCNYCIGARENESLMSGTKNSRFSACGVGSSSRCKVLLINNYGAGFGPVSAKFIANIITPLSMTTIK